MATEQKQSRNSQRNYMKTSLEQCAVVKRANCGGKGTNKKRKNKKRRFMNENDYQRRLQEVLYTPEYIFAKIFRKDGPQLGDEFDSLPEHAFQNDTKNALQSCQENQRALKRRKVLAPASLDDQACPEDSAPSPAMKHGVGKGLVNSKGDSVDKYGKGKGWMTERCASVKRHGIGKGLMTVWQVTNPHAGGFPTGIDIDERAKEKKKKLQQRQSILRKVANKSLDRRKTTQKSRKVENKKPMIQKQPRRGKCELALEEGRCQEDSGRFALLVDDEELELQELQAGPNPLSCCTHFSSNGRHGCALCKGLLANFPPDTVTMKLPLYMQPWGSSPELLKKLFKAYHFLCTYATIIDISSFTLDEFAHAFHVKDSLLLGQVHVVLLKLLLSDVETQLSSGSLSQASKSCNFLGLIQSAEHQQFILKIWLDSLNALTWSEILRQVLAAAGFGSRCGTTHREAPSKEFTLMAKYGLSPGTLKCELFSVLLMHGNNGMTVPDLAKVQTIVELNLVTTANELEDIISSTLSSDITLFEKISSCGYRLRINISTMETDSYLLDAEEDDSEVSCGDSSSDSDSDSESLELGPAKSRKQNQRENKNMLTAYNEIDESQPGEPWLLGLKEGEYSNLSIEEKLNALCALVDLLTATSSFRMQDKLTSVAEYAPVTKHYGLGAKIKRSTALECNAPGQLGSFIRLHNDKDMSMTSVCPVDSSVPMSKNYDTNNFSSMRKDAQEMDDDNLHHMQSIFLGSDRRYNRYWILLGPCDDFDPGHRRIYFESSEDGHWEVIDTEEALCSLLSALDHRGAREARLLASLEKWGTSLCRAMSTVLNASRVSQLPQSCHPEMSVSMEDSSSSAVSDVDNLCFTDVQKGLPSSANSAILARKKLEPQRDKWRLPQAFDTWIWKSFYSNLSAVRNGKRSYLNSLTRCARCHDLYWRDERHCRICHSTFELDFDLEARYAIHSATCGLNADTESPEHKVLSSKLQSLKAAIYAVESLMPEDAIVDSWTKFAHNLWVKRLRRASTLRDVLQVLADFVSAINEDWLYQLNHDKSNCILEEILANFPTMPQTFSAVALWLLKLDALVAPHLKSAASQINWN